MNLNNYIQAATCDCMNMSSLINGLCIQLSFMMDKEKDNNTMLSHYFITTQLQSEDISLLLT